MGRLIVAGTNEVKVPYQMKESGHSLYSYEELCYYIKSRMPLWLMEQTRPGLTDWLSGCGVKVENIDYCTPYEAAEKLFHAGFYYRKEEKIQILSRMREWPSFPKAERAKEVGDLYLAYGRTRKAWMAYAKALAGAEAGEDSWKCSLFHNMGIVCLRLFYWEEAVEWLSKALNIGNRKETENALYLAIDMRRKEWETGKAAVKPELLAKKKQEFLNEL